ncbi:HMG2-induced ER-remodeling protein 1 [Dissostichus eleginoides]|uniref:HMG2-induced ER-remodeling protein 1 n=1 Tax=Dissostichus eleginoides TaxID=100907 RepID=A0AAD9EUI5_DISEL|nr:HMG2-induced ER-remodeling protein 1 [Dissostichus eleginoides]
MPGESAAGDETSSRAAASGRAWQVHAQAASSRGNNGLPASAFSSGAIIQACLGHKSTVLLERPAWPCLCCSMQRICRPHKPTCP